MKKPPNVVAIVRLSCLVTDLQSRLENLTICACELVSQLLLVYGDAEMPGSTESGIGKMSESSLPGVNS